MRSRMRSRKVMVSVGNSRVKGAEVEPAVDSSRMVRVAGIDGSRGWRSVTAGWNPVPLLLHDDPLAGVGFVLEAFVLGIGPLVGVLPPPEGEGDAQGDHEDDDDPDG